MFTALFDSIHVDATTLSGLNQFFDAWGEAAE